MRRALIVLLALWGVALLSAASMPYLEADGLFWGAIAKSMLESGDWLTPRYPPAPEYVVDRPPLTFWVTALFLELGGQSRTALRLWHLLATIGLVATTYAIARPALSVEGALLAALILGTMLQVTYQSLTPQQDIPLTLALSLAFYAWLRHQRTASPLAAAAAGAAVGLATLTKGFAGAAMFAAVAVVHAVVVWRQERRWPWGARGALVAGIAAILVAGPWFVYAALTQGRPFIEKMIFGSSGVDRFFRPVLRSSVPYWQALLAYIPMLAGGVLPWTGAIPAALARGRDAVRDGSTANRDTSARDEDRVLVLCLVWTATILLALMVSSGDKVYRYLVPALVPLAVLMGAAFDREMARGRLAALACGVATAACVVFWLVLLWVRSADPAMAALYMPIALPVAVAMTIAVAAAGIAMVADRPRAVVCALAAGGVLTAAALQWGVRSQWDRVWPWPQMAALVRERHAPGDRVVVIGSGGPFTGETNAAAFYFSVPVVAVDDPDEIARIWRRDSVYAVLPRHALQRLPEAPRATLLMETPLGWQLVTNRPDAR
jgi:4-amino-4-deoxy-L-arabinose transferase-like glycosyltransferase